MSSPFPLSPVNGDTYTVFGRSYEYSISKNAWFPISSPLSITDIIGVDETIDPQVGDILISDGNLLTTLATNSTSVYQNISELPLSGNEVGSIALVIENNRVYLWKGDGWFSVALLNTSPTITVGPNATYALSTDGTPTVITLAAVDPEEVPITWTYSVTSGSLEDTTVTSDGPEFTITPGEIAATFELTFTASDGINIDTSTSAFTLSFGPDWSVATLAYTLNDPNPYGTVQYDYFGWSTAIDGNYAIVSAPYEGDASGDFSGKAYIFDVTTGTLVHTLDNPNPYGTSTSDGFGTSVAISGNYAIVGAFEEDDAGGTYSGKAYIFNVTTGTLLHTLDNPNPYSTSANDQFGISVGISGNYAIVGANLEDDSGGTTSGKAYIFNVTTGALVYTLDNSNAYGTSLGDNFGFSVGISGNYAIVGAYGEDDALYLSSGKAYIYNVITGQLLHTLNNPNAYDTSANDRFGESVAIDGNYAIVGTYNEDDAGGTSSGKAYIFDVTTGALVMTLDNPNPYAGTTTDEFAFSVAISGDYAIAGARNERDPEGTPSGRVYIFQAG